MGFKPRTSLELNIFHIERTLKKIQKGEVSIQECGLNKRFEKLKKQSEVWYDDLHPKYIAVVRQKSFMNTQYESLYTFVYIDIPETKKAA